MRRFGICAVAAVVVFGVTMTALVGTAGASPAALKILIDEAQCEAATPPETLATELRENPAVAEVELFDGATATPTAAELRPYDVVVAIGDCNWLDAEGTGDALADFQDAGGVVVGVSFDWETTGGQPGEWALAGRWIEGGYSPFLAGETVPGAASFEADGASPFLEGVGALTTANRDDLSLAPGATEIGRWNDGTPAVAVKGNALGINSYLGDYTASGTGNYGQLIVNAARILEPRVLTVTRSGTGSGSVSSAPAGISCGTACAASFPHDGTVTLTARPDTGSEFAGWSGACSGTGACVVTVSQATGVDARFDLAPTTAPTSTSTPPPATSELRCIVPRLLGKTVKAARSVLRRHHCALGKIGHGRGTRIDRIAAQHPKVGAIRAAWAKVNVLLEPKPAHDRRRTGAPA